jgi:hypothetical protein
MRESKKDFSAMQRVCTAHVSAEINCLNFSQSKYKYDLCKWKNHIGWCNFTAVSGATQTKEV